MNPSKRILGVGGLGLVGRAARQEALESTDVDWATAQSAPLQMSSGQRTRATFLSDWVACVGKMFPPMIDVGLVTIGARHR